MSLKIASMINAVFGLDSHLVRILSDQQKHYLDFLLTMTEKEIKARYKFATLGFLWIALNPLLQMLVMGFIFQFFVPVKVDNYFLFLFTGLLPWNFFSMTVTKCTPAIIFERTLIQKAKFARETIVLSIVLSNLFHFLISFGILLFALITNKMLFDHFSLLQLGVYTINMLWTIPLILWLVLLTAGFSLFMAALNVKYRDVNFVVQAIMPLWFYAVPIVYSLNLLPQKFHILFLFNPLTTLIEGFQVVLLHQSFTSLTMLAINILISLLFIVLGWLYFQKESKFFDDWM